jgi:hypothetical protein
LVADVLLIERLLTQDNLEHSHNAGESELVEAFFGRFVLVHNCNVANAVDLMESLNTMFDELSKFDSRVDSVRNTLDDDLLLSLSLEEVVSSLQVAADSDLVLNTDFVSGE